MSRIDHEIIWNNYFGCRMKAECPICQKEILFHDHKSKENGWHRGHIISLSSGGPDILCNLMPICIDCNGVMKNKNLFTFLYEIGQLSINKAKEMFSEQKLKNKDYDPFCSHRNYGVKCKRRKTYLSSQERPSYWFNPFSAFSILQNNQFCKSHAPKADPMLED